MNATNPPFHPQRTSLLGHSVQGWPVPPPAPPSQVPSYTQSTTGLKPQSQPYSRSSSAKRDPRMTRRALILLMCGCAPQLKPETLVEKLRVLSITAEPPEVKPGQS